MTPLEEQLVDTLIKQYKSKGVNVQGILDNPEFLSMPLKSKLAALEHYAKDLSVATYPDPKTAIQAGITAAGWTGATLLVTRVINRHIMNRPELGNAFGKPVLAAAAIGGTIGLLTKVKMDFDKYKADQAVASTLGEGNYMEALVGASMGQQGRYQAATGKMLGGNPIAQVISNQSNVFHAGQHHTKSVLDIFRK